MFLFFFFFIITNLVEVAEFVKILYFSLNSAMLADFCFFFLPVFAF